MRNVAPRVVAIFLCMLLSHLATCQTIEKKIASTHPMHYCLSLPNGWKAGRQWPVVVAIEDADRDFKRNADVFVKARGDMPFILVIPEVITNGGSRYREATGYSYKPADWDRVAKDGEW